MKLLSVVCTLLFAGMLIFSCQKEIVSGASTTATGTLSKTASGDCAPVSLGGVFVKNTLLDTTNYMDVQVDFTAAGNYEIKSDTVNGYSFKGVGQTATAGLKTIRLKATGKPVSAGVDVFTIQFNNSICKANVTVSTATAVFTLGGAPSACTGATLAGVYTNGVALTAANTVSIQVNVSVTGAYAITTDTVNGMWFSSSGTFTATGVQSLALAGNGVPLSAGPFTIRVGGTGGCTFTVTVSNAAGALATLTTTAATGIACTLASSGGNISNDGGSPITARGICFSTTAAPTTAQNVIANGTGTGSFISNITGLTNNTTYYVRAFATNSAGTAYGNEISFTTTAGTCPVSIYVAGYEDIYNISGNIRTPKVWTNSTGSYTGVYLPVTGYVPQGDGLFVSGTDVYVAGKDGGIAKLWKNGVASSLSTAPVPPFYYETAANAVYVDGTDVYVAGYNKGLIAAVWKNGVANNLTNGTYTAAANAVFVSGGDVYVAGYENEMVGSPATLVSIAKLWKNGVPVSLTNGSANSTANSVFVSGSDVYVAGVDGNNAKVWKNGVATSLAPANGHGTVARSVYVAGGNVYVAGIEHDGTSPNDFAVVWKNGTPVYLTTSGYRNYANSVFVVGTDVYVAGSKDSFWANSIATVWKNGFATPLTSGSTDASANCIFVK